MSIRFLLNNEAVEPKPVRSCATCASTTSSQWYIDHPRRHLYNCKNCYRKIKTNTKRKLALLHYGSDYSSGSTAVQEGAKSVPIETDEFNTSVSSSSSQPRSNEPRNRQFMIKEPEMYSSSSSDYTYQINEKMLINRALLPAKEKEGSSRKRLQKLMYDQSQKEHGLSYSSALQVHPQNGEWPANYHRYPAVFPESRPYHSQAMIKSGQIISNEVHFIGKRFSTVASDKDGR